MQITSTNPQEHRLFSARILAAIVWTFVALLSLLAFTTSSANSRTETQADSTMAVYGQSGNGSLSYPLELKLVEVRSTNY